MVDIRPLKVDLEKLSRDPKSESNDPDPYPTRHPKYAHLKVDPKSELTRLEPYPTRNFLQSCLFWHDECIWPKIGWPEIDLNWTISDLNRIDPKCHLTRTWSDPYLTSDPYLNRMTYLPKLVESLSSGRDLFHHTYSQSKIEFLYHRQSSNRYLF